MARLRTLWRLRLRLGLSLWSLRRLRRLRLGLGLQLGLRRLLLVVGRLSLLLGAGIFQLWWRSSS